MTDGPEGAGYEACVSRQIEAAQAVARRLAAVRGRPDAAEALIEAYDVCRALWSPDYGLIDRCLEVRLEGG